MLRFYRQHLEVNLCGLPLIAGEPKVCRVVVQDFGGARRLRYRPAVKLIRFRDSLQIVESCAEQTECPRVVRMRRDFRAKLLFGHLEIAPIESGRGIAHLSCLAWAEQSGGGQERGPVGSRDSICGDVLLRRDGFESAVLESLGSHAGISWVMELGSPASARAALATTFHYSTLPVGGVKLLATFSDPAAPGSRGCEVSGHGSHGQNILFADGPFLYLLGDGWLNGSTNPPTRSALLVGLTRLYKRVHGHPAA